MWRKRELYWLRDLIKKRNNNRGIDGWERQSSDGPLESASAAVNHCDPGRDALHL